MEKSYSCSASSGVSEEGGLMPLFCFQVLWVETPPTTDENLIWSGLRYTNFGSYSSVFAKTHFCPKNIRSTTYEHVGTRNK